LPRSPLLTLPPSPHKPTPGPLQRRRLERCVAPLTAREGGDLCDDLCARRQKRAREIREQDIYHYLSTSIHTRLAKL
jgi:hypothetical protein